ncbi:MAG: hypothetical protein KatS3mg108_0344 [Isosphaeraceae bacterium]|nr:MAG: hypothetical protein KatS3mg108_0344 [Isosphaeraceae bacterium]
MSDAQERTPTPSPQRRQWARQAGLAPHSPELTSALALLAGVVLAAIGGKALLGGFIGLVRAGCQGQIEPAQIAALALPALGILLGVWTTLVIAHLFQTGGLWAPAALRPDWSRLTPPSAGGNARRLATSLLRGLWLATAAAAVLLPLADRAGSLTEQPPARLLEAASELIRELLLLLAAAWVAFGLLDYAWRRRAFETQLRPTPQEQREEQRAIDGDPAIRSRRHQLARAWLRDPGELRAGAALVVTGPQGLSVLISGGPPPAPVGVRTIARGIAASTLRHAAERAGLPVIRAPELAVWFAQARLGRPPLPPHLAEQLQRIWPHLSQRPTTPTPRPTQTPGHPQPSTHLHPHTTPRSQPSFPTTS